MATPVKLKCTVSRLIEHGEGVYTVEFAPDKRIPRFKTGQFLHLTVDAFDPHGGHWPESRVFSIASEPRDSVIRIVYSVKGRYTQRMSAELAVGRVVWLKLPYGDFIVEKAAPADSDIVLIAGGTGVAPFVPYLANESGVRRVHLVYGAREPSFLLFQDLLSKKLSSDPGFSAEFYVENKDDAGGLLLETHTGRIPIEEVWHRTNSLRSPAYFLSGPPSMIFHFKDKLTEFGVCKRNVHVDEWS